MNNTLKTALVTVCLVCGITHAANQLCVESNHNSLIIDISRDNPFCFFSEPESPEIQNNSSPTISGRFQSMIFDSPDQTQASPSQEPTEFDI